MLPSATTFCFIFHSPQHHSVTTVALNIDIITNATQCNSCNNQTRETKKQTCSNNNEVMFVNECCHALRAKKESKKQRQQLKEEIIICWSILTSLSVLVFIQLKAALCIMHLNCGLSSHFKWAFFSPE